MTRPITRHAVCVVDHRGYRNLTSSLTTTVLKLVAAARKMQLTTRSGTLRRHRRLLDVKASRRRRRPAFSNLHVLWRTWRRPVVARPTSSRPSYFCRAATLAQLARTISRIRCKSTAWAVYYILRYSDFIYRKILYNREYFNERLDMPRSRRRTVDLCASAETLLRPWPLNQWPWKPNQFVGKL